MGLFSTSSVSPMGSRRSDGKMSEGAGVGKCAFLVFFLPFAMRLRGMWQCVRIQVMR